MVTRIGSRRPRRLYVKEHIEASPLSVATIAGRIGVERQSVYRYMKAPFKVNRATQAALEDALELPEDGLYSPPQPKDAPPPRESLDKLAEHATDEQRDMLVDIVKRVLGGRG